MRNEMRLFTRGPVGTTVGERRGEKRPQPEPEKVTAPVVQEPLRVTKPATSTVSDSQIQSMLLAALIGGLLILFVYKKGEEV